LQPEKPETLPSVVKTAVIPAFCRSTGPSFASCHVCPVRPVPPEGVAADSHGTIYAAAVPERAVYKYVKK